MNKNYELTKRIMNIIQKYRGERSLMHLSDHDGDSQLLYHIDENDEIVLSVLCSDTFHYACADCEAITYDNIDIFEKSVDDCCSVNIGNILFVARVRNMKPLKGIMDFVERIAEQDLAKSGKDYIKYFYELGN